MVIGARAPTRLRPSRSNREAMNAEARSFSGVAVNRPRNGSPARKNRSAFMSRWQIESLRGALASPPPGQSVPSIAAIEISVVVTRFSLPAVVRWLLRQNRIAEFVARGRCEGKPSHCKGVGDRGLEPLTSCVSSRHGCASQLVIIQGLTEITLSFPDSKNSQNSPGFSTVSQGFGSPNQNSGCGPILGVRRRIACLGGGHEHRANAVGRGTVARAAEATGERRPLNSRDTQSINLLRRRSLRHSRTPMAVT